MTSVKIPRIDYKKKGDLKAYIAVSRSVKKVRSIGREVIKELFSPKRELSDESFEDHISRLHGKVLCADAESAHKIKELSGKSLVLFVKNLKTSHYK